MSFFIPNEEVNSEILDIINKECTIKPKKTQYNPNPDPIICFNTDSKGIYVPMGLWRNFYDKPPNDYNSYPKTFTKCTKKLYTIETDPKGYRDQDVVFDEAYKKLKSDRTLFLSLNTGYGKTTMGNIFSAKLGLKTAVLCHLDMVNKQWIKEFKEHSDAKVQRVEGSKEIDPDADVYIIGIQKANSLTAEKVSKIGTVIVDESHICTHTCFSKSLPKFQPKYIIALSATPTRPDGLQKLFTPYFGIEKNFIKRHEIKDFTIYKVETPYKPKIELTVVYGNVVPNWNTLVNSLEYNEERQNYIVKIACKHVEHRILILCNRQEQSKAIYNKLKNLEENVALLIGQQKTYDLECRILVAGMKKCGVGFDDPTLTMLILASDSKNVEQFEGRIRTTDNIIYDIVDDNKTLEKHWDQREKWYIKRGAKIQTINLRPTIKSNNTLPNKRLLKSNK